jgi:hypothetical protein
MADVGQHRPLRKSLVADWRKYSSAPQDHPDRNQDDLVEHSSVHVHRQEILE